MFGLLVFLGIILALALWVASNYNALVTARNVYKNAFAQIDVQLQRRFDLIPNLVEVARKYMAHERETLEARLELWLDHTVAPTLPTERAKDESEMVQQMVHAMDSASKTMESALQNATGDLKTAIDSSRAPIVAFNKTVDSFNGGVRDFSEFNYNLRGTVEVMAGEDVGRAHVAAVRNADAQSSNPQRSVGRLRAAGRNRP